MKNIAIYLIPLFMTLLLLGCSKEKTNKVNETKKEVTNNEVKTELKVEAGWPDNEYTKQILEFTYGENGSVYSYDEDGFIYNVYNVLLEDYNTYIKTIKKAGFNKNVLEQKDEYTSFTGDNGFYQINVSFNEGYVILTVIKVEQ